MKQEFKEETAEGAYNPGGTPSHSFQTTARWSNDLITSTPHPGWRNASWKQDRGGPFEVVKRTLASSWKFPTAWHDWFGTAIGDVVPYLPSNDRFPAAEGLSDSDLRGLGTLAIAAVAPTVPRFQAQTALAELKEGLPRVIGLAHTKGSGARSLAEENLNYQFGIAPTISDIRTAYKTVQNADKLWEQYKRNSGKLRRRTFRFDPTVEVKQPVNYVSTWWPGYFIGNNTVDVEIQDIVQRRIWFSGCFVYYVPRDPRLELKSRLRYLYGIGIETSPLTAWNVLPYSWLADWFGNIGDVVKNVSAFLSDGLVMPYGYLMENTFESRVVVVRPRSIREGISEEYRLLFQTERKKRIQASPYGFDVEWPDLSARRLGILASLGVTRAPR